MEAKIETERGWVGGELTLNFVPEHIFREGITAVMPWLLLHPALVLTAAMFKWTLHLYNPPPLLPVKQSSLCTKRCTAIKAVWLHVLTQNDDVQPKSLRPLYLKIQNIQLTRFSLPDPVVTSSDWSFNVLVEWSCIFADFATVWKVCLDCS